MDRNRGWIRTGKVANDRACTTQVLGRTTSRRAEGRRAGAGAVGPSLLPPRGQGASLVARGVGHLVWPSELRNHPGFGPRGRGHDQTLAGGGVTEAAGLWASSSGPAAGGGAGVGAEAARAEAGLALRSLQPEKRGLANGNARDGGRSLSPAAPGRPPSLPHPR